MRAQGLVYQIAGAYTVERALGKCFVVRVIKRMDDARSNNNMYVCAHNINVSFNFLLK